MSAAPTTFRFSWSSWDTKRVQTRKGLDYAKKKKPEIVSESMKEFSKDRYGVDVLKVEVPINMKYVEGTQAYGGQKAYSQYRSERFIPESRYGDDQAVHLPFRGREQCRIHRGSGIGR